MKKQKSLMQSFCTKKKRQSSRNSLMLRENSANIKISCNRHKKMNSKLVCNNIKRGFRKLRLKSFVEGSMRLLEKK